MRGKTLHASLLVLYVASVLITGAAQLFAPQTAHAEDNKSVQGRFLVYLAECLSPDHLDADGKANDNNKQNIMFESLGEMFKPGERIAVDIDLESDNGVMTCATIAHRAVPYISGGTDQGNPDAWIERVIWGKSISDNGGVGIPVGDGDGKVHPADVRKRAAALSKAAQAQGSALAGGATTREMSLNRMEGYLRRCFKDFSDTPPDKAMESGSISYPSRNFYALRNRFDWKDVKSPHITPNDGTFSITSAELGDIGLDFKPGTNGYAFNDRTSHWMPIGNDPSLPKNNVKEFETQSIASCNYFQDNSDFFFGSKGSKQAHWIMEGKALKIWTDANGNGKKDPGEVSGTNPTTSVSNDIGDSSSGSDANQCIVTPPLSWILCPIITISVQAIGWLDQRVVAAVKVPPLTTGGAFEDLHNTWTAFRDLANAFLVLVFLITIFAQVLPIEVDPYMVKRVLPKIIAAAIMIQFSYFMVQILFDISRVLGQGVGQIIASIPSGSAGGGLFGTSVLGSGSQDASATSSFAFVLALTGTAAGITAVATVGWAVIVPLLLVLLSALISIITLFLTLQIRMVVIIIMTMISPLAILAWILPNTENYFKKWLTGLTKLLMMYPIIVFMISSSSLIMRIAGNAVGAMSGSDEGTILLFQILVSVIPVVIFFMIPATFKWAGGIFATLSSAVQSQGSKWSKRARGGALMKSSLQGLKDKAGVRLYETQGQKGFGRIGARVASGNAFSFGDTGKRKMRQSINAAYGNVSEAVKDQYQDMSNDERYKEMQRLLKSTKPGDKLKATALGDMIAANGGGVEMAKYLDELEYVRNADGTDWEYEKDASGNDLKDMFGNKVRRKSGKVHRNASGALTKVDDEIWAEIAKRNGSLLATAVPHSVSKPISQAGATALIDAKGRGAAEQMLTEVAALHQATTYNDPTLTAAENAQNQKDAQDKITRLANQFVQASQRENAGDMHPEMVKAFKAIARSGLFTGIDAGVKGFAGDVGAFINKQTSDANGLIRYVQG